MRFLFAGLQDEGKEANSGIKLVDLDTLLEEKTRLDSGEGANSKLSNDANMWNFDA